MIQATEAFHSFFFQDSRSIRVSIMEPARVVVPGVNTILEVLNLHNYEDWSVRVKTYLKAEGLWEVVKATAKTPGKFDTEYQGWKKKNTKALHSIQNSCGSDVFRFIRYSRTANDAWKTLEQKLKPVRASQNTDEGSDGRQVKDLDIFDLVEVVEVRAEDDQRRKGSTYTPLFNHLETFPKHNSSLDEWNGNEEVPSHLRIRNADEALAFLTEHPEAVRERHPSSGLPALHLALLNGHVVVAQALVELMTKEELEMIRDSSGRTALCATLVTERINYGNRTAIAKRMVKINERLPSIVDPSTNMIPVVMAYSSTGRSGSHAKKSGLDEVARYLYSVTPLETMNPRQAAELISISLRRRREFDIPMCLIRRYPLLGITKDFSGQTPLYILADTCGIFPTGLELKFWQQWIYDSIDTEQFMTACVRNEQDTRLYKPRVNSLYKLFGGDRILDKKLIHIQAFFLLYYICGSLIRGKSVVEIQQNDLLRAAIFRAVEKGQVEFIFEILCANKEVQGITNEKDMTVLQYAANCRQDKVYNLITRFYDSLLAKANIIGRKDKFNNNILHAVGSFTTEAQVKIAHIRGAALQMQREMQWFMEVTDVAPFECHHVINHTDQLTPVEVFAKHHNDLMKEGEKSMKETATSCTVVGALIVTIMFAAAFTIPGGNDQNTGFPMFSNAMAFMIFIVCDAISLFSSTTSVMIFLGILTSRYKMNDFIKSLPSKMIAGLFTLFLSVATMMIAFSAALYITLQGNLYVLIPVILLSSVPIASFVWMQFPFFVEIFISTYGASLFVKRSG